VQQDGQSQNIDRAASIVPRNRGISAWTPNMSHDDFVKLQAHIPGGSRDTQPALHVERDGVSQKRRPAFRSVLELRRPGDRLDSRNRFANATV